MKRRWFYASTCRGPWASIGVHVDFAGPFVDVHIGWWIISIGRLRHVAAKVE